MTYLPVRQVHLDFHTGDDMPDVGSRFSEQDFRQALTVGHISSVTLFAKCHHGWAYYPSAVVPPHPTMTADLLGRQLAVCREMGVRAQVYISAGFDEHMAVTHPEYRNVLVGGDNTLLGAHFHQLCLNNDGYLEYLCAQVAEVMTLYGDRIGGIFTDICTPAPCVCPACIRSMLAAGLNPENPADVRRHARAVYSKFTDAVNRTVAAQDPAMPVFHNCGDLPRNDRAWVFANTAHLELESLPTGGWGYDHFPLSAAYCRVLGREFIGMTGKFHTTWGEFGGYKHPNALRYETGLSLAMGGDCSIGDQLHPLGMFDPATYRLIGSAYAEVERREPWCFGARAVADIALFTAYTEENRHICPDIGANRILLEGKYLYNIIDRDCDFSAYKLIVFPDTVRFDGDLAARVREYLAGGGRVLLSGESGRMTDSDAFFADFGVTDDGENPHDSTYLCPTYDMKGNGRAAYLMYRRGRSLRIGGGVRVLAEMQDSYFNRSFRHFCSHFYTPNDPDSHRPGCVLSADGRVGCIAWYVFDEYRANGAYHQKQIVCDMLDALLGDAKTLETDLPSNGVTTLLYQEAEHRYVQHLLYAVTKQRGRAEVIEDAIPLRDVAVTLRLPRGVTPHRVMLVPDCTALPFTCSDGCLRYTVPEFTLHGMVAIEV